MLDHLLHVLLRSQSPEVRCYSFVDNWDLITWDPSWACQQLDLVLSFASKLGFSVGLKKTYGWSTCAEVRFAMRAAGIHTKHAARDLGAHVGDSRQHTNSAVKDRVEALDSS